MDAVPFAHMGAAHAAVEASCAVGSSHAPPIRGARSCPDAWCSNGAITYRRREPGCHAATAGRMTMGLSLMGAMVSSVM